MRPKLLVLALGVPLLAACSFLLDFNGLQGGKKSTPDAGAGSSGADSDSGNQAGASGASDASACDGLDPCTLHSCSATANNGCAQTFTPGLGLEKDFPPIMADAQNRVTMTAGAMPSIFRPSRSRRSNHRPVALAPMKCTCSATGCACLNSGFCRQRAKRLVSHSIFP